MEEREERRKHCESLLPTRKHIVNRLSPKFESERVLNRFSIVSLPISLWPFCLNRFCLDASTFRPHSDHKEMRRRLFLVAHLMECPFCSHRFPSRNKLRNLRNHLANIHREETWCPVCYSNLQVDICVDHVVEHFRIRRKRRRYASPAPPDVPCPAELTDLATGENASDRRHDVHEDDDAQISSSSSESEDAFEFDSSEDEDDNKHDAKEIVVDIASVMSKMSRWQVVHQTELEISKWSISHRITTRAYRELLASQSCQSAPNLQSLPSELGNLYRSIDFMIKAVVRLNSKNLCVRLRDVIRYWWLHPQLQQTIEERCSLRSIDDQLRKSYPSFPYSTPSYQRGLQ